VNDPVGDDGDVRNTERRVITHIGEPLTKETRGREKIQLGIQMQQRRGLGERNGGREGMGVRIR